MLYKYLLVEIDAEFGQHSIMELTYVIENQMQEQKKKISGRGFKFQITSCNYLVLKWTEE